MKKGLIFVLFALVSIVSYSQVSWNVKAGMTMNNVTKMDDYKMKLGYTFGVGVDYAINDMWAIQSGLNIASKGTKFDYVGEDENGDDISCTDKINPVYLELPILAAVKFPVSDNMKFVVNAGPYLAFGLGGKYKDDESSDGDFKLFKKEDGASEAFMNRFDLGLQYGVGLEFGHYLVNLSGQYGFLKPLKGDAYNNKGDKVSPKNLNFAITVGYKF